jgi:aldehyde dehydrogenase (NAD+)
MAMPTLPPIVSALQAQRIGSIVDAAIEAGARPVCGGGVYDGGPGGAYFQPTLLEGVTADNPAVQQEIFGPVLTVQVFDDEEEGLALAAHESYGLAAGVHTADLGRAMRAMRTITAGPCGSTAMDAATTS